MPVELPHIDLSKMTSIEQLRTVVQMLMNLVESLSGENAELKKENQELKDTINLLKGEQARPKITGSGKKPNQDTSCQGKEKSGEEKSKQEKPAIQIDTRPPILHPKAEDLPADAVFKFYKTVVVQDVVFKRNNVEYTLALYWSPSLQTTFAAELPLEHRQGGYGSNLRALMQVLHQDCKVTQGGLEKLLSSR